MGCPKPAVVASSTLPGPRPADNSIIKSWLRRRPPREVEMGSKSQRLDERENWLKGPGFLRPSRQGAWPMGASGRGRWRPLMPSSLSCPSSGPRVPSDLRPASSWPLGDLGRSPAAVVARTSLRVATSRRRTRGETTWGVDDRGS